jgi:hypothetical protein
MQSIDMLLETTREFLQQIAALLPRLTLALAVLIIGWLAAKAIRFAVERALRAVNFHVLTERGDTTTLFGLFAYWLVMLAALIIAFNGLGVTYITDLLQRVVLFSPKILVAMLVIIFGSYFARFVGSAVHTYCVNAKVADADVLSRVARYLIMTFVVMIALSQIEVGGDIVQKTFLIILGGLMLALALAFGLGGKNWAAALLERWWPQHKARGDPAEHR